MRAMLSRGGFHSYDRRTFRLFHSVADAFSALHMSSGSRFNAFLIYRFSAGKDRRTSVSRTVSGPVRAVVSGRAGIETAVRTTGALLPYEKHRKFGKIRKCRLGRIFRFGTTAEKAGRSDGAAGGGVHRFRIKYPLLPEKPVPEFPPNSWRGKVPGYSESATGPVLSYITFFSGRSRIGGLRSWNFVMNFIAGIVIRCACA